MGSITLIVMILIGIGICSTTKSKFIDGSSNDDVGNIMSLLRLAKGKRMATGEESKATRDVSITTENESNADNKLSKATGEESMATRDVSITTENEFNADNKLSKATGEESMDTSWHAFKATRKLFNENKQGPKKRGSEDDESNEILKTCYSGNLYKTVKALGVLSIPGVRMVKVSGELYDLLLKNNTLRLSKKQSEAYKGLSQSSNDMVSMATIDGVVISKRSGTDICEETAGVLFVLAHASGQLAYEVTDVDCDGVTCYWSDIPIGYCNRKDQTIVLYIIDSNGNFVPTTKKIGCGCECMLD